MSATVGLGERRYDLDWVRVGAFLLLILYHIGMYYVTWDWHVKSPHASSALHSAPPAGSSRQRPRRQT